jgi:hypothetical protein
MNDFGSIESARNAEATSFIVFQNTPFQSASREMLEPSSSATSAASATTRTASLVTGVSTAPDLYRWAFDCFASILDYEAEAEETDVTVGSERGISKTCSACGTKDGNQRVERGLYVCEECDTVANAEVNGAENIRRKVTLSPSPDRSNSWLAQPSVRLFDCSEGRFVPREQVVDCKPNIPTRRESRPLREGRMSKQR